VKGRISNCKSACGAYYGDPSLEIFAHCANIKDHVCTVLLRLPYLKEKILAVLPEKEGSLVAQCYSAWNRLIPQVMALPLERALEKGEQCLDFAYVAS
jgi:hypothetical protein